MTHDSNINQKAHIAALAIIDNISNWLGEAQHVAMVEQDYEMYDQYLYVNISKAIRDAFLKPIAEECPMDGHKTARGDVRPSVADEY